MVIKKNYIATLPICHIVNAELNDVLNNLQTSLTMVLYFRDVTLFCKGTVHSNMANKGGIDSCTTPIQKIRIMKRNMVKGNENRIY